MKNQGFKAKVFKLISENKPDKAIKTCMEEFDINGTHYEKMIIISSNFNRWKSNDIKGLEPEDKVLNKINDSIIRIVNDYLDSTPKEHIRKINQDKTEQFKEEKINESYSSTVKNLSHESIIREKAKREYPSDFEMQKYVMKQQMNAFQELKKSKPNDIPDNVFKQIRGKAKEDYPSDFEMQKHVEDGQIASYRNLKQMKLNDIPNDIFKVIYDKATSEYPNDFEMQEHIIKQQVKAYKELNTN